MIDPSAALQGYHRMRPPRNAAEAATAAEILGFDPPAKARVQRAYGGNPMLEDWMEPAPVDLEIARTLEELDAGTLETTNPRLRCLADVAEHPELLRAPEPIIPRLVWSERSTLLAAREKGGKSTMASAGTAAVSAGGWFLGEQCPQGRALWVLCEEHLGDLVPRLQGFGADFTRIYTLEAAPDPRDRFKELEAAASEVGPVVVVVDTLASFAEGLVKDPNSSSEYGVVVNRLTRLSRTTRAGVLLLAHARKSDGQYRDSSAIGAGVDVVLEMAEGDEVDVRKLKAKARWSVQPYRVRLVGQAYELVDGELSLDTRITLYVQGNPRCGTTKIRNHIGGRASDVDAAIQRLVSVGVLVDDGDGHGHQYRYPGTGSGTAGLSTPNSLPDNGGTDLGTAPLSKIQTLGYRDGTGSQWRSGMMPSSPLPDR